VPSSKPAVAALETEDIPMAELVEEEPDVAQIDDDDEEEVERRPAPRGRKTHKLVYILVGGGVAFLLAFGVGFWFTFKWVRTQAALSGSPHVEGWSPDSALDGFLGPEVDLPPYKHLHMRPPLESTILSSGDQHHRQIIIAGHPRSGGSQQRLVVEVQETPFQFEDEQSLRKIFESFLRSGGRNHTEPERGFICGHRFFRAHTSSSQGQGFIYFGVDIPGRIIIMTSEESGSNLSQLKITESSALTLQFR
jgi:hypothetical protein